MLYLPLYIRVDIMSKSCENRLMSFAGYSCGVQLERIAHVTEQFFVLKLTHGVNGLMFMYDSISE